MPTTITPECDATIRFLDELFGSIPLRNVAFRLWDGTLWPDEQPRPATVVLKHPGALREMFSNGTEKGLAEAFVRQDFDVQGDIEATIELADVLSAHGGDWRKSLRNFFRLNLLPTKRATQPTARTFSPIDGARHTLSRDRQAVSFHYDLSNDFYRLWLDRRMVYSCAYFENKDATIDEAQGAKLRHICRKLRLQPGQRLLDLGCGWGGLAIFAAQEFGASITGITLSQRQAELASERVRAAGLADNISIELRDYRELSASEPFDAIVSVGMSEHVGAEHLPNYFKTASALLKPGGVFLNHAIGEGVHPRRVAGPTFMDEYVFPDGEIPPLPTVLQAAESAGFEVRDVENLREHYALTLRHWLRRLEAAHDAALTFVNEATFRIWRAYLSGSAHGFVRGQLAIYQALLSKPTSDGTSHLPLTRRDWYPT